MTSSGSSGVFGSNNSSVSSNASTTSSSRADPNNNFMPPISGSFLGSRSENNSTNSMFSPTQLTRRNATANIFNGVAGPDLVRLYQSVPEFGSTRSPSCRNGFRLN